MSTTSNEPLLTVPGMTSRFLDRAEVDAGSRGRLRYLTGGRGAPLVLLHTVRTQAEHFAHLIPLIKDHYTVYALDLPGMGHSDIVPGASYDESAMRDAVKEFVIGLDLNGVTILGESMGAVLALTAAADLPERITRVISVNPYDYRGGISRSSVLARTIIAGVLAPGIGPKFATVEPKPVMRAILRGGLGNKDALHEDYLDELLNVGRRDGYPIVARAVYGNLDSQIAARGEYARVSASIALVYGERDWSRTTDRSANRQLLPDAEFLQVAGAGHFIALERPDVLAELLLTER